MISKHIKDNKPKKVFGGIAVFENGEWLYNDNEKYEYDERIFLTGNLFMGSGTTAIASMKLNRSFIGMEAKKSILQ